MLAFQEINRCRIEIVIRCPKEATDCTLEVEVAAYGLMTECGVAPRLACQRFLTGLRDRRTIDAAILQGLYRVDGMLAREELAKVKTK